MKHLIFLVILLLFTGTAAAQEDIFWFRGHCINHGYALRSTPWVDERISKVAMFPDRTLLSCDDFSVEVYHIFNTWEDDETTDVLRGRSRLERQYAGMALSTRLTPVWYEKTNCGAPDRIQGVGSKRRTFAWDEAWPENYWAVHHNIDNQARRVRFTYDDGRLEHEWFFVPWSPAP
jgi:hypothetical protein